MKEKTCRLTLAYAWAGRRTLTSVPWPSVLHMKASITLHCHRSCIHATRFPIHCKLETTQKNGCTPPPSPSELRLLAHRLAQSLATHWGRYIATPSAMKTTQFNQSFVVFHTLPTRYDVEKACTPLLGLGDVLFSALPSPASGNSLGAVHSYPQCNDHYVV